MYPDLSYLFHDLFGTPVDNWTSIFKTFGLMLALAFIACAALLKSELKRKEAEGLLQTTTRTITIKEGVQWKEIIYNSLVLGFLGLKIPFLMNNFGLFQENPAGALFSLKGNWLTGLVAFAATAGYSYYVQSKEKKKPGVHTQIVHPHEYTGDIIIVAAVSGILGAKLFSILENLEAFFQDPIGQLISGSGLTVYGGLLLAIFVLYYYVKKRGIPPIHMMDIGGLGILLGYAIGRIGCQLSGDGDWGIVAAAMPEWWFLPEWMWAYHFPNNVANSGVPIEGCDVSVLNNYSLGSIEQRCLAACGQRYCHELNPPVYPTSFYETTFSLTVLGLLWIWRRKFTIAGTLFCTYLIINGFERFFIEKIRVNEKYTFLGVEGWSQAQYISILFILAGIAGWVYLYRRAKKKA